MKLDKPGDRKDKGNAENISEFESLHSQLDEFIEKETLDQDNPESARDGQHRLDDFVENLQQQMDEFSATHSEEPLADNDTVEPALVDPFSPEEYTTSSAEPAYETDSKTDSHISSDRKPVYLGGAVFVIAAIAWIVLWPDSMDSLQKQLLVEEVKIEETIPETLVVAERMMQEEKLHEEIKTVAEPVDILLPELVVTADVGNMRSKPSTASQIVMKLKQGTVLPQLEKQGDWFKVQLPDSGTAWAYKSIVSLKRETVEVAASPAASVMAEQPQVRPALLTVSATIGNIRVMPSSSADVLIRLKRGAVVTQLKSEGEWLQVRLGDGRIAWAHESIF